MLMLSGFFSFSGGAGSWLQLRLHTEQIEGSLLQVRRPADLLLGDVLTDPDVVLGQGAQVAE